MAARENLHHRHDTKSGLRMSLEHLHEEQRSQLTLLNTLNAEHLQSVMASLDDGNARIGDERSVRGRNAHAVELEAQLCRRTTDILAMATTSASTSRGGAAPEVHAPRSRYFGGIHDERLEAVHDGDTHNDENVHGSGSSLVRLLSCLSQAVESSCVHHATELRMWEEAWSKMYALISEAIQATASATHSFRHDMDMMRKRYGISQSWHTHTSHKDRQRHTHTHTHTQRERERDREREREREALVRKTQTLSSDLLCHTEESISPGVCYDSLHQS